MQLVYFGKKDPKVVTLTLSGKKHEVTFAPFRATEVDDEVGAVLLKNAGDIFKRYDIERSAPDPKPQAQTKGYVGDKGAEQIKDLDKELEKEKRIEEGKDADDILAEEQNKSLAARERRKAQALKRNAEKKEILKKEKLV